MKIWLEVRKLHAGKLPNNHISECNSGDDDDDGDGGEGGEGGDGGEGSFPSSL